MNWPEPEYYRDPLDHRNYKSDGRQAQLWHDIRLAARTNEELQYALDRVKLIYYMSNEHANRHSS